MSSSRLTSITRQQGAPSDDLVQTNPMPAASGWSARSRRRRGRDRALVRLRLRPAEKQDAAAGIATVAMAAAPTRARAAYISAASCQPADCFAQSSKIAMVRSLGSA